VVGRSTLVVRNHMKLSSTSLGHRGSVPASCAVAWLVLGSGCTGADDCTHTLSAPLRSPNGQWTAQATETICGGSDSIVVELSRHKRNYLDLSGIVFQSQALREDDMRIRWLSNYGLELTVPSHTNIETLTANFHGIDVSLDFVPPDSADRAKWVSYRRAFDEWTDQMLEWDRRRGLDRATAGPPPNRPQWRAATP